MYAIDNNLFIYDSAVLTNLLQSFISRRHERSEEMAQRLRAKAAFAEDLDLIPFTPMPDKNHLNSSSRESDAIFQPPQVPDTQMVPRHTCEQNTHTNKIKF